MLNISGIQEGFVLDHIQAGMSLQICLLYTSDAADD